MVNIIFFKGSDMFAEFGRVSVFCVLGAHTHTHIYILSDIYPDTFCYPFFFILLATRFDYLKQTRIGRRM